MASCCLRPPLYRTSIRMSKCCNCSGRSTALGHLLQSRVNSTGFIDDTLGCSHGFLANSSFSLACFMYTLKLCTFEMYWGSTVTVRGPGFLANSGWNFGINWRAWEWVELEALACCLGWFAWEWVELEALACCLGHENEWNLKHPHVVGHDFDLIWRLKML